MIKTVSIACLLIGAGLIALAAVIFFKTNAYAVYKDLVSTQKIQNDTDLDDIAKSIYYENQVTEPAAEETPAVANKRKLSFMKERAVKATDDTSILYEEELMQQQKPKEKPRFIKEKKPSEKKKREKKKHTATAKDEINTGNGTGVLDREALKNIGIIEIPKTSGKLDKKPPEKEAASPAGTAALFESMTGSQGYEEVPAVSGKSERLNGTSLPGAPTGTAPLQEGPASFGMSEEALQTGTEPLYTAEDEREDEPKATGTEPLHMTEEPVAARAAEEGVTGTSPLYQEEPTSYAEPEGETATAPLYENEANAKGAGKTGTAPLQEGTLPLYEESKEDLPETLTGTAPLFTQTVKQQTPYDGTALLDEIDGFETGNQGTEPLYETTDEAQGTQPLYEKQEAAYGTQPLMGSYEAEADASYPEESREGTMPLGMTDAGPAAGEGPSAHGTTMLDPVYDGTKPLYDAEGTQPLIQTPIDEKTAESPSAMEPIEPIADETAAEVEEASVEKSEEAKHDHKAEEDREQPEDAAAKGESVLDNITLPRSLTGVLDQREDAASHLDVETEQKEKTAYVPFEEDVEIDWMEELDQDIEREFSNM